jgi:hypothetical protein
MLILATLLFDIIVLWFWYRYKKRKGEKLPWYAGWILPSDAIFMLLMSVVTVAAVTLFFFDVIPFAKRRTKIEMIEIQTAMIKSNKDLGEYPTSLQDLIGSNPMRKEWLTDEWGTMYRLAYQNLHLKKITSAGKDKKFDTKDDIHLSLTK